MNGWTVVYDASAAGFDHWSHMQFLLVPTVFLVVGLVLRLSPRARARVRSGIPISWIPWIGAGALAIMGAVYGFEYRGWLDLEERLAERRVEVAVGPLDRVVERGDGERIDGELAVRTADGVREYRFPANRVFLGYDGRSAGLTPGTCARITSVREIVLRIETRAAPGDGACPVERGEGR